MPNSFPDDPDRPGEHLKLRAPKDYSERAVLELVTHLRRSLRGKAPEGRCFCWRGSDPPPAREPSSKKVTRPPPQAKGSSRHVPEKKAKKHMSSNESSAASSGKPSDDDAPPALDDNSDDNDLSDTVQITSIVIEQPDGPAPTEAQLADVRFSLHLIFGDLSI